MQAAQVSPLSSVQVGEIQITYLPDGEGHLAPTAVFPSSNEDLWAAHAEYLDENKKLVLSVGGFLIQTGDRKIVVDLGFGDLHVPFPALDGYLQGGRLMQSLQGTGVRREEVDAVFYTHMHLDHVGWTSIDGALTFPNARYLAGEGEWDFWRSVADEGLAAMGPHPASVQGPLEGHLDSVADGASLGPGVTAIATPGHTPGHCSVVISSGTERAIILGDTVHCPLQFDQDELSVLFDVDPALAKATRDKIAAELEGQPHTIVGDGHFSNSAFGRLVPGEGKRWTSLL